MAEAESLDRANKEISRNLQIDHRSLPAKFLGGHIRRLANPERFLIGTAFEMAHDDAMKFLANDWPERISVRDYLTILGNLATRGPDAGYHVDYAAAGVPLYYGHLDRALRVAPTIHSVLELIVTYGSDRSIYLSFSLYEEGGFVVLEMTPTTALEDAYAIAIETPTLVFSKIINMHAGDQLIGAKIEFRHAPTSYKDRLSAQLPSEPRYGASRNAILVPRETAHAPSLVHFFEDWVNAKRSCAEELRNRTQGDYMIKIREVFLRQMAHHQRPPKLSEIASALGVSDRTLIRRLQESNLNFQQFKDSILKAKAGELLSKMTLNIEDIAEQLGFADASGFHRSFKRWYGKTPREYGGH